ncbi:MFS transporter [Streptococcus merionis]|uniref:Major facilitator superfamily permease n=1 Tax=Streptococcus merionis TaxID=400065 RepID=A0A239SY43_9STRE|nr:MFS transporter [Streptococcus merionis]SNU89503.1 major facilitator superfamily permease [Streptococcus merionis]
MQRLLEKISILSLSLMLVSTFAVSPAIPAMISHFGHTGYQPQQVEFLITVTSFAIMASLFLNPLYMRVLTERQIISLGLILVAIGGGLPLLTQLYPVIFAGRILLGIGLGMINARAINIVSTHYVGKERLQMMGWRGSMEVLGSASLTALVGGLLAFGWHKVFAIYPLALIILVLYLLYVPQDSPSKVAEASLPKGNLSAEQWRQALGLAFIAFFVINVNSALTLKIPTIVQVSGLGTAQQASLILSAMMLMGILAGIAFGSLIGQLKDRLLGLSVLIFSTCILLTSLSTSLVLLSLSAVISGFFYSIILTVVFNKASEKTPKHLLNTVMTVVLVGCNLGGATSSLVPPILEKLNQHSSGAFGIYAILGILLGGVLLLKSKERRG